MDAKLCRRWSVALSDVRLYDPKTVAPFYASVSGSDAVSELDLVGVRAATNLRLPKFKHPFLFPLEVSAKPLSRYHETWGGFRGVRTTTMHLEQIQVVLGHLHRRVRMWVHNSWWKLQQRGLMWSERGKLLFPDIFRLCVRNVLWGKASDDLKNTLNLQHEGRGLHQAGGSCRGCQSFPEDDTGQEFRGVWGSAGSWRLTFTLLYCF